MMSHKQAKSMSEEALLKRQRRGAMATAAIVGAIAFGIFIFTLYVNG